MTVLPPSQGGLGWVSLFAVQLATPIEPARAVSIAINTLRSFPKLKLVLICDMCEDF